MTNRKYKLRYLPVFEQDLVQTVSYITNVLKIRMRLKSLRMMWRRQYWKDWIIP